LFGRQLVEEVLLHVDHDQAAAIALEQLVRLVHRPSVAAVRLAVRQRETPTGH
jgi:hypothetical protein